MTARVVVGKRNTRHRGQWVLYHSGVGVKFDFRCVYCHRAFSSVTFDFGNPGVHPTLGFVIENLRRRETIPSGDCDAS